MADYSAAASGAESNLGSGFVEEYQHGQIRTRRGTLKDQVNALARLEGLAARRSEGGLLRIAKPQEPSDE